MFVLWRQFALFLVISATLISCSVVSNDLDAIKVRCKTSGIDRQRSYVAIQDNQGNPLDASEFAARWLDDTGAPFLNGQCLELERGETRSLIIRSRLESEGRIFAADGSSLSQIRLEKYTYGPLSKTCDQLINTNHLSLGLPISFGVLTASGYGIQAKATADGQEKKRWDFVNAGSSVPTLDLAALSNGRYALQIELNPLFSEGAVAQSFSCDLVVDRKAPQISLLTAEGGQLAGLSIEVQPGSRIAWKNLNKTADEILEYCFIAADAAPTECKTPSISSDLIVMPEQGAWRLLYRGVDAAQNASDWAALDVVVVDELKLAAIRSKLELARFYQKSGQTQFVAIHLLEALETSRNLPTALERMRVKKDLDIAIFQHQWDARDALVAQWDAKEVIKYLGSISPPDAETVHVFSRQINSDRTGLNFISSGKPVMPEIPVTGESVFARCDAQDRAAFIQNKELKLFNGKTLQTLPVTVSDLAYAKQIAFSEDCRFVRILGSGYLYLVNVDTGKNVMFEPITFPNHSQPMRCLFGFALGEGDETKYFNYCRRNDLTPLELHAVDSDGNTLYETSPLPAFLRTRTPSQVMAWHNYLFIATTDKSFAIFDKNLGVYASKQGDLSPGTQTEELIFDRLHQRLLVVGPSWGVPGAEPYRSFDEYTFDATKEPLPWKSVPNRFYIDGQAHFGGELVVSQPAFSSNSYAPDLFVSRFDTSIDFYGVLPIDRDRFLYVDAQDQILLQLAKSNVFRETSPNESLLRRTIRLGRNENVWPIEQGTKTLLFSAVADTYTTTADWDLFQSEVESNKPFVSLKKINREKIAERQDPTVYPPGWMVYPNEPEPLIMQIAGNRTRFQTRDASGHTRITTAEVPVTLAPYRVRTSDPDLFWFITLGGENRPAAELNLYTVRVSTGEVIPVTSFLSATSSAMTRVMSPLAVHFDAFNSLLYMAYADFVLKVPFRGPLDNPVFTNADKKDFKPALTAVFPMPGFKKWALQSEDTFYFYNDHWETIAPPFKASDANASVLSSHIAVPDLDTILIGGSTAIVGSMTRVDIPTKTKLKINFGEKEGGGNGLRRMFLDDKNRLNSISIGEYFTLPLDLADNTAHLCRYLSGLGVRLYPELQERLKQTDCGKKLSDSLSR